MSHRSPFDFPVPLYNVPKKQVKFQRPTKRSCACGCGLPVSGVLHGGRSEKFVRGHQNKHRVI